MDSVRRSHRFAGACIAAGSLVLLVTITLYFTVIGVAEPAAPGLPTTMNDVARHFLAHERSLRLLWSVEAAALALIAVSSFTLCSRSTSSASPTAWFWTAAGLGAAVNLVMYAYTIGMYPAAAAVTATSEALLQSVRGAAFFLFFVGNALISFGFAGVYVGESKANPAAIPRWLSWTGAMLAIINTWGAIAGLVVGPSIMSALGPTALLGTLVMAVFGFRIATRG